LKSAKIKHKQQFLNKKIKRKETQTTIKSEMEKKLNLRIQRVEEQPEVHYGKHNTFQDCDDQ
jgi:hypothetical protein